MHAQQQQLPSLRSLNLLPERTGNEEPIISRPTPRYAHPRNSSISSLSSVASRTPSPPSSSNGKLSLEPCALKDAEAIIYFPAPPPGEEQTRSFLVVGNALESLVRTASRRELAKGARVHPYRKPAAGPTTGHSRRTSTTRIPPHV
ncbi:hypothetical protein CYLTODRAFT_424190 [Cylindrobasidium torrendii FP15055 ss-10]|uniref:Uncharacterized protein n=1 Tax=Cylindrobasidium torrendii FP15055 ss-10 TaxID=1314674 RepID=A0A0D7B531_9AGAR|nr:hypothetical protein CYLTODRAFT_424190 [Cylindrobasidium torrendii FP15055 ss-10]